MSARFHGTSCAVDGPGAAYVIGLVHAVPLFDRRNVEMSLTSSLPRTWTVTSASGVVASTWLIERLPDGALVSTILPLTTEKVVVASLSVCDSTVESDFGGLS